MIHGPVKPVQIADILDCNRDDIVIVKLPDGHQLNLKRSLVDFAPGVVILPRWLWELIFEGKRKT